MNLTEAFQKMDLLESEDFNVSSSIDSADLRNFLDTDEIDNTVDIIDVQSDTEEDLEDSYIGKVVTECTICHSKFYKDPSEIKIDEETGNCNLDEECPVCFSQDGYKVIGKIAPYDGDNEITGEEDEESEIEVTDVNGDGDADIVDVEDEEIKESLKRIKRVNRLKESVKRGRAKRLKESKKHLGECGDEMQEGILGAVAGGLLGGAVGHPVIGAMAGNAIQNGLSKDEKDECLEEDFESATIETDDQVMTMDSDDNGKVTVTTEPKSTDEFTGEETIAPLDAEDEREITGVEDVDEFSDEEEIEEPAEDEEEAPEEGADEEVDVDEFDEDSFDDLGESYLKRVYENVNSYKTTSISSKGRKLIIEGVIRFNSGKTKKTSFIFESFKKTNSGRVKFIGENAQITRGRKAFTVTGRVKNKQFISESFNYNYRQKDSKGKSTRLYGTVKR